MDVTRIDFNKRLPSILKHISNSHFISFDLELSGIPDQRRNRGDGPKSLADRYKELKIAAETYHILQVGLTCVEEDKANSKYLVRSYNFNISPLVDDQLDLERNFTYSTGAVDFLLRHDYKMESPFTAGIPYLTRTETQSALETALSRWDAQVIPDIAIKPDDTKALSFMKRVREEVDAWLATESPKKGYVNITGLPVPHARIKFDVVPLNRFEKRLAHQVIRAEYPSLQTSSRVDGIQIKPLNKDEQQRIQKSLHARLKGTISNQVGFRWLAEAMAGGDLSGLDLGMLCNVQDEVEPLSTEEFKSRIDTLFDSLRQSAKVLVGHNCLLDLVYFFRSFYGPLPDTVAQFQQQVHELFPLVVDTKYLSTAPGSTDAIRFRNSQLGQIEQALSELETPWIADAENHLSYHGSEQYHEAGYDSYVTAKVFLKLASKIASEHAQFQPPDLQRDPVTVKLETKKKMKKMKPKDGLRQISEPNSRSFFHQNSFSSLAQDPEENTTDTDLSTSPAGELPTSTSELRSVKDPIVVNNEGIDLLDHAVCTLDLKEDDGQGSIPALIPPWDAPFWTEFGNRIRVYGTAEELCKLVEAQEPINNIADEAVIGTTEKDTDQTMPVLNGLRNVLGKLL